MGGSWSGGSSMPTPPTLIYDPVASTWTDIGPAPGGALMNTTTLLPDGRVFSLAGYNSAWLYDPAANLWSPTADAPSRMPRIPREKR